MPLTLLLLLVAGCGGGDANGARVTVYVVAPLCPGAEAALPPNGGEVGSFHVAVVCLPSSQQKSTTDLATAGANARRATEDTSAVALLEPPGRSANFTRPILETANLPLVLSSSGAKGMERTLAAIEAAGTSAVRDDVQEALEPS